MNKQRYDDLIRQRMKDIYLEKSHMMGRGMYPEEDEYEEEGYDDYMFDDIRDIGGAKGQSFHADVRRDVFKVLKNTGMTLSNMNKKVKMAMDIADAIINMDDVGMTKKEMLKYIADINKTDKKFLIRIIKKHLKKWFPKLKIFVTRRTKRAPKKRAVKKRAVRKRAVKKRAPKKRSAPKNAWQAVLRRVFDKNRGKKTFKQSMAEAKKVYAKLKPRVEKCQIRKYKKCGKKPTRACKARERKACAEYKYVTGRGLLLDY